MRKSIILIFIFWPLIFNAQKNTARFSAILITTNHDTIKAQILVTDHANNIELSNLFDEVSYIDSSGKKITATPEENILSFHFTNKVKKYSFQKISLKDLKNGKRNFGFGLCLINGYLSLYQYAFDLNISTFKPSINPNKPSSTTLTQRYIYHFFQKQNTLPVLVKRKITLSVIPKSYNKQWLRNYFQDNAALVKKIGRDIPINDLETMVLEYNKWILKVK